MSRIGSLVIVLATIAAGCSSGSDGASSSVEPLATQEVPPITDDPNAVPVTEVAPTEPLDVDDGRTTEPAPQTTAVPAATTTVAEPAALPAGYDGYMSEIYGDDANWICKPGTADDVCARDLDATIVNADGTTEVLPFEHAENPAVDCFYVYPTVSGDQAANSDLIPAEDEEISTVLNQAARLGAACNVFAPVYRQRTLAALLGQVEADDNTRTLAYDDVLDSFKYFIANESNGRPFVLVGHSQGAGLLSRLIDAEIDDEPLLRDRLVSALILGAGVSAKAYDNVPACASTTEIGCVVSYASFRSTAPPPDNSIFGRTADGPALCVNPADPAGGAAVLSPYFRMESALLGGGTQPFDDPARNAEITTPFVLYPDMVSAQCVDDGTFGYLELTIITDEGPRTDDVGGDLSPEWGMHLIDANVAMGDLVALVASQAGSL
jgi:hypothetical protein